MTSVYASLATIDFLIAILAGIQVSIYLYQMMFAVDSNTV